MPKRERCIKPAIYRITGITRGNACVIRFCYGKDVLLRTEISLKIDFLAHIMNEKMLLNEQNNQLAQFIEYAPIAVAMLDLDMRYLRVNQRWMDDFALEGDIIGKSHYDVFPEIGDNWKEMHQRCLQGEIHHDQEVSFTQKDGTIMWFDRNIRPWTTCNGEIGGLLMYVEIITDRKMAQEALQAQHQFLRRVIDLNTSFIFAKDETGKFTLVNKALADAYDSTPDEMVGKYDADFNPDKDQTQHFKRVDLEVIRTRAPQFISEEPVSNVRTGEVRWYQTIKIPIISQDGLSVQLLGVATDITDRKQAQDELARQHRFLRQVIDLNTSFIFAKDENGKFTLVNQALADAYGSTPEKMVGKSDGDFNSDTEQVKNIRQDDMDVLKSRKSRFIAEEPITHFSGETRWYQTTKIPIISEDGKTVQLLGVATDITERKRAEDQLQRVLVQEKLARQAAEEASHMKDLFLANMSHELRTPLNAIIGFLREMLYSNQLDNDNTHMAQRCLANSKRLHMLINSLLDLSRLAVGSLELVVAPVNPHELATMIHEDLLLQARDKGLTLKLEVSDTLPDQIFHDEERLIQIITNLIINAIKYTETGSVTFRLSNEGYEQLKIDVIDTGIGIPEEMQNYIFEDFARLSTNVQSQGVGLGLSIVKNLVRLMDGTISLQSSRRHHTIFTVNLPLNLNA